MCLSTSPRAEGLDDFKKWLRPHAAKVLSSQQMEKYFGFDENTIQLPKIPKVNKNAKSIEEIGREDKNINFETEEKRQKYDYHFVAELFVEIRKRKANDNELAKWMNVLQQGGTREGIYRALVLDNTYTSFERIDNEASDEAKEFAKYYLTKFLSVNIKEKALNGLNFYSLKRIGVEKTLELVDVFLTQKNDDIFDWYAVFSSSLASRFPKVFKNKLRINTSKRIHREWAKKVPLQYIKSEVILKLHKGFNSYQ
jgi:hypothetical protein